MQLAENAEDNCQIFLVSFVRTTENTPSLQACENSLDQGAMGVDEMIPLLLVGDHFHIPPPLGGTGESDVAANIALVS